MTNECPIPNGSLVIIGGAEQKKEGKSDVDLEVLKKFLELIGKQSPTVEVITTAGQEDIADTFETYQRTFRSICDCTVNHIHHQKREAIDEQQMLSRINNADAFFFAGGDQLRLTSIYGGTTMMLRMKERYIEEKLIIAGTSAGAMALSTPMIFAGTGAQEMIAGGTKITTGFEFLKDICIDTHFVSRGRFVRMAQVIATNPSCLGIGIEENTALVVENGINARIIGCGVVVIIDATQAKNNNITSFDEERNLSIRDLKVSILAEGDQFEIKLLNPGHR